MNPQIISKAPARICLFGDHQDYLNLPIIACAINRYITLKAIPNHKNRLHVYKEDLDEEEVIEIDTNSEYSGNDYLRVSLVVLKRYGCIPNLGYDVFISGNIPINAGLSSSSALTVAWIQFLIKAFGIQEEVSPRLVAKLAYEVEVVEQNTSGGKMDQYTISLGNSIYMNTETDAVETLPYALDGMIIGDSGEEKNTLGTLAYLKQSALQSIAQVQQQFPSFHIPTFEGQDLSRYAAAVEEAMVPIFEAAVFNYKITQKAKRALLHHPLEYAIIGDLMTQHHTILKDNLQITTPKIDAMIQGALEAGAYGAKIVGSGNGGCMVALSPKANEERVIQAIKAAGAKDAFMVEQSKGATTNLIPHEY